MSQPKAIPIRRYRRFPYYDYTKGAALFVTIATEPRRCCFGIVHDAKVELSELGVYVLSSLEAIPSLHHGIELFDHVVMPDHVHFNLHIVPGLPDPLHLIGVAISGFKGYTTKQFHKLGGIGSLWQQGYHDYLCPGRAKIEATGRYIRGNPLKWEMMQIGRPMADHQDSDNCASLCIREPLGSPFLDPAEFWRGVGEIGLLDSGNRLVSVRISRKIGKGALNGAIARLSHAVDAGYVIVSHFASPGERALRDMLLARKDARFIVVSESQIHYGYKPDSRFLEPIWAHRCLIIGKGNKDGEFDRVTCLDVNAEIRRIALASEGYATYWKQEGVEIESPLS